MLCRARNQWYRRQSGFRANQDEIDISRCRRLVPRLHSVFVEFHAPSFRVSTVRHVARQGSPVADLRVLIEGVRSLTD